MNKFSLDVACNLINRLVLQNVGLRETLAHYIRYTMRSGADVEQGLSHAQKENVSKANIFGAGYELGQPTTLGCSYKGRIWSKRKANLLQLTEWCSHIGRKILDSTIDDESVLKGTLAPTVIGSRPLSMPLTVEWPEAILGRAERVFEIRIAGGPWTGLHNITIELLNPSTDGNLCFRVRSDTHAADFKQELSDSPNGPRFSIVPLDGHSAWIRTSRRQEGLASFLSEDPPTFWFVDGSCLEGVLYTPLSKEADPYPLGSIVTWDWTGVDITKEAQGVEPRTDSIQYAVIERLKSEGHEFVVDDDGAGEIADVVAIRHTEHEILVKLYHCKYSSGATPGARIGDLYEVCGQAQKSVGWLRREPSELFKHLIRREPKKSGGTERSRFEVGDAERLIEVGEKSRLIPVRYEIFVVQPGLSKAGISDAQRHLLGVTENYLMETRMVPFCPIVNE